MIKSDREALNGLANEIDAVATLTGNHGKKVGRILDAFFPIGMPCLMQVAAPSGCSALGFALYLKDIREGCEQANDSLVIEGSQTRFEALVSDRQENTYFVHIVPGEIPESMRRRQAFLRDVGMGLELVLRSIPDHVLLVGHFFEQFYQDAPHLDTMENREALARKFNGLLAGDYQDILDLPSSLVELAALLEPNVGEALRSAIEGQALPAAA